MFSYVPKAIAGILFCALFISQANAYFYKLSAFRGDDNKLYICLSDNHIARNLRNATAPLQKAQVLLWAKNNDSAIVAEGIETLILHKETVTQSPLKNLIHDARQSFIEAIAVEFRTAAFISNTYSYNLCKISAQNALSQIFTTAKKIDSYNDNDKLNALYHKEIDHFYKVVLQSFSLIKQMMIANKDSLHDLLSTINYFDYKDEIFSIINYAAFPYLPFLRTLKLNKEQCSSPMRSDTQQSLKETLKIIISPLLTWKLLDPILLHTAYNLNKSIVIIAAGGAHIDHLHDYFSQLKWPKIFEFGKNYSEAIDLDEAFKKLEAQLPLIDRVQNYFTNLYRQIWTDPILDNLARKIREEEKNTEIALKRANNILKHIVAKPSQLAPRDGGAAPQQAMGRINTILNHIQP